MSLVNIGGGFVSTTATLFLVVPWIGRPLSCWIRVGNCPKKIHNKELSFQIENFTIFYIIHCTKFKIQNFLIKILQNTKQKILTKIHFVI